jgi:hypothetical protein
VGCLFLAIGAVEALRANYQAVSSSARCSALAMAMSGVCVMHHVSTQLQAQVSLPGASCLKAHDPWLPAIHCRDGAHPQPRV